MERFSCRQSLAFDALFASAYFDDRLHPHTRHSPFQPNVNHGFRLREVVYRPDPAVIRTLTRIPSSEEEAGFGVNPSPVSSIILVNEVWHGIFGRRTNCRLGNDCIGWGDRRFRVSFSQHLIGDELQRGEDMATTMRAALDDGSGIYRTQDVPMPEMFEGAALVRVRQTGICGSDLHMTTRRDEAQDLPSGHEVTGEIVELPSGNHKLQVGDRVAIDTVCSGRACFDCRYCNYGQYRH